MNISEKNGCLNLSPESGQEVCDFCSSEDVNWSIDCEDIIIGIVASRGDWAACTPCKELVASKQWLALENKAVDTFMAKDSRVSPRAFVHELHSQFRLKHGEVRPFYKNVA